MPSVPDLDILPPELEKRCEDAVRALEDQVEGLDDPHLLQASFPRMSSIHERILNESI